MLGKGGMDVEGVWMNGYMTEKTGKSSPHDSLTFCLCRSFVNGLVGPSFAPVPN